MTDAVLVFPPGFRLLDADGNVVSGGSIEFYQAGTSNARTVYSDSGLTSSLGSVVYLDSGGYPVSASGGTNKVSVYTGTSAYKVIIKTSAAVTLATIDNLSGALDTSTFAVASAAPERPVVSRSDTSWTVGNTSADAGKVYKSNPNSGAQTVTLPSAVTVGDGFTFTLVHDGGTSSNTVTWQTVSSQTVDVNGVTRAAGALIRDGEAITFVSDGANWTVTEYKPGAISDRTPFFTVADRLTAPPTSPTPGARYIINGTPTGAWSSYALHDVVEATGVGTWVRHTPTADCGWFVYVEDENLYTAFVGSAWADQTGMPAGQSSNLKLAIFAHTETANTAGGQAVVTTWTARKLNTETVNTITGCTLSSNQITLPAGQYLIRANGYYRAANDWKTRFKSTTTATEVTGTSSSSDRTNFLEGYLTLSASETFEYQYYASANAATNDLGDPINQGTEYYAVVTILSLASLQGPQGIQGAQGPNVGLDYAFDSATTDADPGTGELRFNNATLASVTNIYISKTGRNSESLETYIGTWDDTGTSSNRSTLLIRDINSAAAFLLATVNGNLTDGTTYWKIPVTIRASGGTFTAGDILNVFAIPTGDTGTLGGTLGATANIIPRTSGTGGSTLQASGISAGTTGNDISHSGRTVQPWVTLTLVNGANTDVTLPEGTNFYIAGPTGIFTLSGVTGGVDGRLIRLYNSVDFAMTLANDATSANANRFLTMTGANVSTTTQGVFTCIWSSTANRWLVMSVQT